jgi:tRNA(Ile)-lysidine synthase
VPALGRNHPIAPVPFCGAQAGKPAPHGGSSTQHCILISVEPLHQAITEFLGEHGLEPKRMIVAVSGGPDSVAMLLALHEFPDRRFDLSVAHVHHHLRDDADEDARFVDDLGRRLGIDVTILHADVAPDRIRDVGVEAAAREARYALLESEADRLGADFIATAHTQNDQAETLLMRLVTGSGSSRLRGIAAKRGRIIRPLLNVSRDEIERFLDSRSVTARVDTMNADPRFLRTRIRHELLPLLESINPRAIETLAESAAQIAEEQREIDSAVAAARAEFAQFDSARVVVDASALGRRPWMLRRLLLEGIRHLDPDCREVSAEDLRRLARVGARTSITADVSARRDGPAIVLERVPDRVEIAEVELTPGDSVLLHPLRCTLTLTEITDRPEKLSGPGHQVFEVPLETPLSFTVRGRRDGDRFFPLGAPAEKKLKDFLISRKISAENRDKIPLLLCNGEIVWVAGVELSDKFKVRNGTGRLFRAEIDWGAGDANAVQREPDRESSQRPR